MNDAERGRQHGMDIATDMQRAKRGRRIKNAAKGAAAVSLAAMAMDKGLDRQAEVDAQRAHDIAPIEKSVNEQSAENRAQAEAADAADAAATYQSGEVEVSEAGTTGYVNLDSPTPDDMGGVEVSPQVSDAPVENDGTGGVAPEVDPGTGGVEADSSAAQ